MSGLTNNVAHRVARRKTFPGCTRAWQLRLLYGIAMVFSLFFTALLVVSTRVGIYGFGKRVDIRLSDGTILVSVHKSLAWWREGFQIADTWERGIASWGLRLPTYRRDSWPAEWTRRFELPLWIPTLAAWGLVAVLIFARRGCPPNCCNECGYDLTGNTSGICPECGASISQECP